MKIYVNDFTLNANIDYDIIEKKSYIYTSDGIYLYKKELKKIETIEKIREKKYKNYLFLIDESINEYTEVLYHIPYIHLFCQENIFKKSIGDGIYFVKNTYFDQTCYYFETDLNDSTTDSELLYDALITFLSSN